MEEYKCPVCGYVYNNDSGDIKQGIAPGTKFINLPDDYVCPICGLSKEEFKEINKI